MDNCTNDPDYVPIPTELTQVQTIMLKEIGNKTNQSHINLAIDVLKKILQEMYGPKYMDNPLSRLYNEVSTEYKTFNTFNNCTTLVVQKLSLAKNTYKTAFYMLKRILKEIGFPINFVNKLNLYTEKPLTKYDTRVILKTKYNKMDDNSPIKKMLINWINLLKTKTKNRSPQTIKIMIAFFLNTCIPVLGLSIDSLLNYTNKYPVEITEKDVTTICTNNRKYRWFNIFCEIILGVKNEHKVDTDSEEEKEYVDGDMHVITADELDKIYLESKKNTLDELIFLLLITTGMRVGGMLNIRIPHVCNVNGNEITVFDTGRTLEKGCKWFDFVINDRVKKLIVKWIIDERRGNTDYLFSSSRNLGRSMASITIRIRFKKLCESAGLVGRHLHLHSLRHSYAHILLKCGNSMSIISKLLNHSNTLVTEKFYLRETISEVTNRANIPWIKKSDTKEKIIPDFLNTGKKCNNKIKRLEYLSINIK